MMKIGQLAAASDTAAVTIRYYETEGLLPRAGRTESNYRMYSSEHLARLLFVRHCRGLGMSLDEVRVLLRLKDTPTESCESVNHVLDAHIQQVTQRIRELRTLERDLKALRASCGDERTAGQCGILDGLATASKKVSKHARGRTNGA